MWSCKIVVITAGTKKSVFTTAYGFVEELGLLASSTSFSLYTRNVDETLLLSAGVKGVTKPAPPVKEDDWKLKTFEPLQGRFKARYERGVRKVGLLRLRLLEYSS